MVAREGFVYEQKPLSVTRNVVVREGWSLVRVVVRQGFYCSSKIVFFEQNAGLGQAHPQKQLAVKVLKKRLPKSYDIKLEAIIDCVSNHLRWC